MAEKRTHNQAFQVGPANLPDGTRKRKADRIKQALIDRAKLKHDFAKVKKRRLQDCEEEDGAIPRPDVYAQSHEEEEGGAVEEEERAVSHVNPDRQALIDGPGLGHEEEVRKHTQRGRDRRHTRYPRENPYKNQMSQAAQRKEEVDRRRQHREDAERQREMRVQEREKMQRMVRKAKRPTVDGKRKLGRESAFLLEKVRRMVNG